MIKIGFSYDCVFWCGDLNFRLEQTRAEIIRSFTFLLLLMVVLVLPRHALMAYLILNVFTSGTSMKV